MADRKKEAKLNMCMLTQSLVLDEGKPFAWAERQLAQWASGDANQMLDALLWRLLDSDYKTAVEEMHVITHNKDVMEDGTPKRDHGHVIMKFREGRTLSELANDIGVEAQYIEKAQRGRYAWDNMLAYLIHAKDKKKHQYEPTEVASWSKKGDVSYIEIEKEARTRWAKGASVKAEKEAKSRDNVAELVEQAYAGSLTKNQMLLDDGLYMIYCRNAREFDDAFRIYGERRALKAAQKIRDGQFKTQVYYITGASGSGKSHFARTMLIPGLCKYGEHLGEEWSYFKSAPTNPVDKYSGEEILFLDDIRPSAMSASDWLQLLDPEDVSETSARYNNKTIAPRAIVITAHQPLEQFFFYVKDKAGISEALDQFIRRLTAVVTVFNTDGVRSYSISDIEYKPKGFEHDLWKITKDFSKDNSQLVLSYGERALVRGIEDPNDVVEILGNHIVTGSTELTEKGVELSDAITQYPNYHSVLGSARDLASAVGIEPPKDVNF